MLVALVSFRDIAKPSFRPRYIGMLVALGLALVLPGAVSGQTAGPFRLVGVHAIGSKRYPDAQIAKATGLKVGEPITLNALQEAAGKLGSLGVFAQVNYRYHTLADALTADFTVQDAPALLRCSFENFVWFTPAELLSGLQAKVPLFDGYAPAGGTMLDLISAQLKSQLAARGIKAEVECSAQGALGGPVQVMQFRVAGVPMPVRQVGFTGNANVDATALQEAARPLLEKDYDAGSIRAFSQRGMLAVYQQRGYLKAAFGDPAPRLLANDPAANAVGVTFAVTEGEQYHLKQITWSGESAIPYDELGKGLHVAVGQPVDAVQLEHDVLDLILLFHPKGYIEADVKSAATLDDAAHLAIYGIQINQGPLYRLGKLEIAGLDEGHANALVRRSQLKTGDPYDATYWDRFLQEIGRQLPPSASGWRMTTRQTIQRESKTVDVRLEFGSGPGK